MKLLTVQCLKSILETGIEWVKSKMVGKDDGRKKKCGGLDFKYKGKNEWSNHYQGHCVHEMCSQGSRRAFTKRCSRNVFTKCDHAMSSRKMFTKGDTKVSTKGVYERYLDASVKRSTNSCYKKSYVVSVIGIYKISHVQCVNVYRVINGGGESSIANTFRARWYLTTVGLHVPFFMSKSPPLSLCLIRHPYGGRGTLLKAKTSGMQDNVFTKWVLEPSLAPPYYIH